MDIAIQVLFGISSVLFLTFLILAIIYFVNKKKSSKFNQKKWDKILTIVSIVLFSSSVISFILTLVGILLSK